MSYETYFIGSTNDIEIDELRNDFTSQFENDASVSFTLRKLNGDSVGGVIWPLMFDYVPESNGRYILFLPEALDLTPGDRCIGKIEATSKTGYIKRWDIRVLALLDQEGE